MVAQLCKFTKNHSIVHLVSFMVCKLCLDKAAKNSRCLLRMSRGYVNGWAHIKETTYD